MSEKAKSESPETTKEQAVSDAIMTVELNEKPQPSWGKEFGKAVWGGSKFASAISTGIAFKLLEKTLIIFQTVAENFGSEPGKVATEIWKNLNKEDKKK